MAEYTPDPVVGEFEEAMEDLEDTMGGPPHPQKLDDTLQYVILVPGILVFIFVGKANFLNTL